MKNLAIPKFLATNYEIHQWRHAIAILQVDFPNEWQEIVEVLSNFRLKKSDIAVGGGNKSKVAETLDRAFNARGWLEKSFETKVVIDNTTAISITSVCCLSFVRSALGLS
jgi:hypothetical protein